MTSSLTAKWSLLIKYLISINRLLTTFSPPPGYDPKLELACVKATKYCEEYKALFMRCQRKNVSSEDYLDISNWSCSSFFGKSHLSYKLEVFEMKISCETHQDINTDSIKKSPMILKHSCWMRYSLRKQTTSPYDQYLLTKALAYCIFFFVFLTVCCIIAYKTKNVENERAAQAEQMQVFCITNSNRARNSSEGTTNKIEDDLPPSYSVLFDNVNSDVAVNVAGHASSSQHRSNDGQ